jgi:hypothetical protein
MSKIQAYFFEDQTLNDIALEIIQLDTQMNLDLEVAYTKMTNAFERRWSMGKLLSENEDYILAICTTWNEFADKFGYSTSVLSNNRRGYQSLLEAGCKTFKDVETLLIKKQINPTVRNFEKIGSLLTTGEPIKDVRPKDEQRLQRLFSEVQEIIDRNETANHNVVERALELKDRIEQSVDHINKLDARKNVWKSKKYLQWVKTLGYDALTGLPCDTPDPHHTDIRGGSGGFGAKLPDMFTIPVSRDTHEMLENGMWEPTEVEIAEALINTMALFIMTHYDN